MPGLEDREVGGGARSGTSAATYSSKSPVKPGSPGHVGQMAIARVTEVWNSRTCERSGVSRSTLTSTPAVLPSSGSPPLILTLTSAHWPSRRSATLAAAVLRRREQHTVVVGAIVVGAVVDVGVEAVLVDAEVEHAQAHLLRRAVRRRHVGPTRRRRGRGLRERRLAGEAGRVVELQAERGDERRRRRSGDDVVRRDAATREEAAEVDRRALDAAAAAAGPLDLGDLLARRARPTGRSSRPGARRRAECRGAVGERLAVDVERVVGRARSRPAMRRWPG